MKNRKVIILIIVYALTLILIGVFQPHEIDWRPTFAAGDKIPYGTYILRQRLSDIIPGDSVATTTQSIFKTLHKKHFAHTNYILIEPQWNGSKNDIKELLRYAGEGNNVLIASENISYKLLDTLGICLKYAVPDYIRRITKKDTTTRMAVSLVNPAFATDSTYEFEANNIPEYFSDTEGIDSSDTEEQKTTDSSQAAPLAGQARVISTVSHLHPIYVKVPVGKGNIYLHSYPYAFTNYYLINDSTRSYAERCLSYLPHGKTFWDEHYKIDPQFRHMSTLGFILNNDSLSWAYYTAAVFLLIFVLFNIKRRQRIIPVVAPYRNATLEFTETVGRLYYNRGDHKNLAEKKIRYFLEYVRSRYYIDTQDLDADFIDKLSNKSGIEKDRVQYMTEVMRTLLKKNSIADSELIQLNELIEYFKKHSN